MNKSSKYSQYNQDKFVDIYFKKKREGFFLDIGAHDGLSFSNTFFFEKERGWSGICIEPNPDVFQKLMQNRQSLNYNVCISDKEGSVIFRKIDGYSEMLSGILEFMDQKHLDRINNECIKFGGTFEDIKIESKNIKTVLDINNLKKIDYLSIDTEGAECDIIKSIDFDKFNIEFMTVENNDSSYELRIYLESKGYKCIKSFTDDFFIKSNKSTFYLQIKVKLYVFANTWYRTFPLIYKIFKRLKRIYK